MRANFEKSRIFYELKWNEAIFFNQKNWKVLINHLWASLDWKNWFLLICLVFFKYFFVSAFRFDGHCNGSPLPAAFFFWLSNLSSVCAIFTWSSFTRSSSCTKRSLHVLETHFPVHAVFLFFFLLVRLFSVALASSPLRKRLKRSFRPFVCPTRLFRPSLLALPVNPLPTVC